MKKLEIAAAAALALLSAPAAHAQTGGTKTYIVQLKEEPAASYQGTTAGFAATQAAPGRRFRSRTPEVQRYTSHLRAVQRSVLARVGRSPLSQYDTVFNGFSARLTSAQAAQLAADGNVAAVYEDELRHPVTMTTPVFLGLAQPGGVWSQLAAGLAVKGEDMVLGDLDTGIWPESPSYADRVDGTGAPTFVGGTLAYGPAPATFHGGCVAAEGLWDPLESTCRHASLSIL